MSADMLIFETVYERNPWGEPMRCANQLLSLSTKMFKFERTSDCVLFPKHCTLMVHVLIVDINCRH